MPQIETQPDETSYDDYVSTRRSKAASPEETEVKAEESEAPEEEAETAAESETEETESEEQPKPKAKGGFQKRIDKLTKRTYELEAEIDRLRSLADKPAGTEKPKSSKPKPDINTFPGTISEYEEALADWLLETKLAEREAKKAQEEEQERVKSVFDSYNRKVAKFREETDDWEEVMGNPDVRIPQAVQLAVVEMENGPEVAYYLGNHPDLCDDLMDMTPMRAVAKIGAISEALAAGEEEETERSPKPKPKSSAPEPITPVGGSARSARPLSEINDADEYMARRRKQLAEARKR